MLSPHPHKLSLLGERYEVLSLLGSGASADVFRVRDLRGGAVRAAKVLKAEHTANAEVLARFEDEFRILRTLHHPHLPEVFDYGTADGGRRFLVMELVEGEPVDQYFRAHRGDIWVILYEICETLVFVHARNLLHQDIKPSNILVSRVASSDGERPLIKLIDFGLTYRRGVGAAVRLVGTAEYIAPEVVRGERSPTRAVDYYSLGATLYELLYGTPPFTGTENEILRAHLERAPIVENEELEWAELYPHVRSLLTKDPQQRLTAFEEFRRAVAGRLTGGIEDLDRSYALARIDSLGMIGKKEAWAELVQWLDGPIAFVANDARSGAHTLSILGSAGIGKRFLSGAFRAEAALRGVRTILPSEIGPARIDVAAARQPSLMWSHVLEMCEKAPVVLIVERPSSLPDEERSFVRLAGTQWELYRSRGRMLPLFFLVVVDSTTEDADTLDYLPTEGAIKIELGALGKNDSTQIVDQFRGAMFDTRDARSLVTYLGRFDNAGGAIQGLQRAVLRGGLTFLGQRWKVQPGLLTEIVESKQDNSYSRDLVASLSPLERSVAAIVAAHPEPVPISWVAEFLSVQADVVLASMTGTARRLLTASTDTIAPANASVRADLRAGSDAAEMHRAHEFLAQRVLGLERTVSADRSLAYHYQQLGQVRDAARVHLRLLRAYWAVRPRERPYELIEGICRSGLELLEAHGDTISRSSRRHLFCFYIKEWIKAFWARNLFTHAKPIIDEWTKRLGETMPASVAPRYVRSVLEREGPAAAFETLDSAIGEYGQSRQLSHRLYLERALAMHNAGDYQGALKCLDLLGDGVDLAVRDRYRLQIYRAMNIDELRGMGAIQTLLDALAEPASQSGCIDEAVLIYALRVRSNISSAHLDAALRDVALGMRLAHRHGLSFRENLLYRLAAGIYGDIDQTQRVRSCQERALQTAGAIGINYMVGTSWARLAQHESSLGRLGNALQHSEKSIALMARGAPNRDLNQAHVALLEALVLSRKLTAKYRTRIERVANSSSGYNERGYYDLWRGRDFLLSGQVNEALKSFDLSRENFLAAGFPLNAGWAGLGAARVYIAKRDFGNFRTTIDQVELFWGKSAPSLFRLDFRVVELKGHYMFRSPSSSTVTLARESEPMTRGQGNVPLKIEMLAIIFRIFMRRGFIEDAERVFQRYRELVTEVVANADSRSSIAIADEFSLGELVGEYGAGMGRRRKGDPFGSPFVA